MKTESARLLIIVPWSLAYSLQLLWISPQYLFVVEFLFFYIAAVKTYSQKVLLYPQSAALFYLPESAVYLNHFVSSEYLLTFCFSDNTSTVEFFIYITCTMCIL